MLTWCFFVLFVFGENRQPLEENQFRFCFRLRSSVFRREFAEFSKA